MKKVIRYFSSRTVSSTRVQAETRQPEPSSQSNPQSVATAGEIHESSTSTTIGGLQVDSSRTDQAMTIPQSINSGAQNVSSSDQSSSDPALNDADKILTALQVVSGMVLPLALPEAAKSASYLLTMFDDKRKNDAGVRNLILEISKIVLGLVEPLYGESTGTPEQEKVVRNLISYLETLQAFCEEYLKGNSVSRFFFSSTWKAKIEDVRRGVQEQLLFVTTKAILTVLNKLNSPQQPIATPHETSQNQTFENANFRGHANVKVSSFQQFNLDQSRPTPSLQGSSRAFSGATFDGNANVTIETNNQHYR